MKVWFIHIILQRHLRLEVTHVLSCSTICKHLSVFFSFNARWTSFDNCILWVMLIYYSIAWLLCQWLVNKSLWWAHEYMMCILHVNFSPYSVSTGCRNNACTLIDYSLKWLVICRSSLLHPVAGISSGTSRIFGLLCSFLAVAAAAAPSSSSCQEISTKWRDYICIQISGTSERAHAPSQSLC